MMVKEISEEEIVPVYANMDPNSCPGLDGFSTMFFKQSWNLIKADVCVAIKFIFKEGKLFKGFNSTHICLIPKNHNPCNHVDYHPILLCNVLYKSIVKIIANIISQVIPSLISLNQTTFIQGRTIQDNLGKGYSRKYGDAGAILKVNLKSAYDSINWEDYS